MSAPATLEAAYYSALAADPDLGEIVALFVDEMPARVRDLKAHFACANWDELVRLAHQLKGAAGSYGFDQITPFAARLETSIRAGEPLASVHAAVEELVDACGRTRAGVSLSKCGSVRGIDHSITRSLHHSITPSLPRRSLPLPPIDAR